MSAGSVIARSCATCRYRRPYDWCAEHDAPAKGGDRCISHEVNPADLEAATETHTNEIPRGT